MNQLASEGVIEADHPVPCRIIANGAIDGELSLAENVVRVAMHPADQVEAFGTLGAGRRQRRRHRRPLRGLGAPPSSSGCASVTLRPSCWTPTARTGSTSPSLKAFAVTTDRTRQLAVWEQVSEQGYRPSPTGRSSAC